jgi:YVTN family beta-propeller protein
MTGIRRQSERFLTSVLMTDIVGSTEHAAELGDGAWRDLVHLHHALVRRALRGHGGREVDTAGDGFFAVFDAPAAAVECAIEIADRVKELGIEIRAGVHVGEVEQIAGKVGGLSVPIAARITALAGPGEILVSSTVRDLAAGAGLRFEDRGVRELKGVPGEWQVYAAVRARPASAAEPAGAVDLAHRRAAAVRRARSRPIWQRRPRVAAGVVATLVIATITSGLLLWRPWQPPALASIAADAVGVIDAARGEIVASIKIGARPGAIAIGEGVAWVAGTGTDTVIRVDLATRTVTREIDVGRAPTGIALAAGSVWVANSLQRTVTRINAATARVVDTIEVGNGPTAIAAGAGSIWVANTRDSTIVRIDPRSGTPGKPAPVAAGPVALAVDDDGVWVASADGAAVAHLDPRTGITLAAPIPFSARPAAIALGAGAVWMAADDGTVTRIDPRATRVTATIDVGGSPSGIAVDEGWVWVSDRQGSVLRLALADLSAPPRRVVTGSAPEAMASVAGNVWVVTRASPAAHRGGTLRTVFVGYNGLDPAVPFPYNAAMLQADGLVGYRRVGGVAGATLLPNLARALPRPTRGGRVYVFQLRSGLVYADGRPVRASDFRRAIERSFQVPGPFGAMGNFLYRSVQGAETCATRDAAPVERCDLSSGIEVDDASGTVAFTLSRPDPDFLAKLALPHAYPVPDGVPMRVPVDGAFPGTGPYVVVEATQSEIRFVRNARFRIWDAAVRPDGFPDEIVFQIVGPTVAPAERVGLIERGRADYMPLRGLSGFPADVLSRVSREYPGQVSVGPATLTAVIMDLRRPPFDRLEVRRAVTMAIDRGRLAERYGGAPAIVATCQFLPPGWPGYRPYCPYTLDPDPGGRWHGPDLEAARRLVEASGTRGAEVVVGPMRARHAQTREELARVLQDLGYRVTVDRRDEDSYVSAALGSGRIQVGAFDVSPAFLAPSSYFEEFTCANATRANAPPCDAAYDALFKEALDLQTTDAAAAAEAWAKVDQGTVDRAPWVPLFYAGGDLVAERVGNVNFHPTFFVLLDQLWVQ